MQDVQAAAATHRRGDDVARGAGIGVDQGAVAADQAVEERALARVRGADQRDVDPLAQQAAGRGQVQQAVDGLAGLVQDQPHLGRGDVGFARVVVAEFERALEPREQVQQRPLDGAQFGVQAAAQLGHRGARGLVAAGLDEVGHCLGLVQGQAAGQEGAARELARRGGHRAGGLAGAHGAGGHLAAAVAEELDRVLAGVTAGAGQVQGQDFVDHVKLLFGIVFRIDRFVQYTVHSHPRP